MMDRENKRRLALFQHRVALTEIRCNTGVEADLTDDEATVLSAVRQLEPVQWGRLGDELCVPSARIRLAVVGLWRRGLLEPQQSPLETTKEGRR